MYTRIVREEAVLTRLLATWAERLAIWQERKVLPTGDLLLLTVEAAEIPGAWWEVSVPLSLQVDLDEAIEEVRIKLRAEREKPTPIRRRLTNAQVRTIRQQYATGLVSQGDLAREYHVSASTICQIVNNRIHKAA